MVILLFEESRNKPDIKQDDNAYRCFGSNCSGVFSLEDNKPVNDS